MKIIIDITKEDYELLNDYINFSDTHSGRLLSAIKDGISIPDNHKLVDADAELEDLKHRVFTSDLATTFAVQMYENFLSYSPSITAKIGEKIDEYKNN